MKIDLRTGIYGLAAPARPLAAFEAPTADQTREPPAEFKGATGQWNAAAQGLRGQVSRFGMGAVNAT